MVGRGGASSLSRRCELPGVGRASLYRSPASESEGNPALMRRIDELYLEHPFHGSRQMARHLAREGLSAGRHRVRLMGLEAICRKPNTSATHPDHEVYPYLLRGMEIDGPDPSPACRCGTASCIWSL